MKTETPMTDRQFELISLIMKAIGNTGHKIKTDTFFDLLGASESELETIYTKLPST